jgi:flagellar hook-associated protein 2
VNSVNYSVTLAPGTYANTQALANALQSSLTQAGASVQVGLSSGALQVTSNQYGSGSSVAVAGGDGASDMFGTTTSTQGLDIAGTINGVAAIGAGQTLTGVTGNSAQGLKVTVNGGALGARGSINYTLGVLTQLNTISNNLIGTNGGLTAEQTGINTQLTQIAKDITSQNSRLQIIQTNYLNQYTALNTLLASLNTQSTFLSQEVSAFSANSSSSSSSSSSTSQNASLG